MKRYRLLKLGGLVLLTMVVLMILSFIEVAVYSYLINPGQDKSVYDAHAMDSAPWISAIFGFIIFFFIVRYWSKKNYDSLKLCLLFVLTYIIIDFIIITAFDVSWKDYYLVFILANGAKLLGGLLGYYTHKPHLAVH